MKKYKIQSIPGLSELFGCDTGAGLEEAGEVIGLCKAEGKGYFGDGPRGAFQYYSRLSDETPRNKL